MAKKSNANEIKKRLQEMNEHWKDGKDKSVFKVQDGVYQMQLMKAEIKTSQKGNLYIAREHLILEGEFEGEIVRDIMSLETDRGPTFVARWIQQCGVEVPDDLTDLDTTIETIAENHPIVEASVKTDGDFQNVNVRNVVEESAEAGEEEEEEENESDDDDEGDEEFNEGDTVNYKGEEAVISEIEGDKYWLDLASQDELINASINEIKKDDDGSDGSDGGDGGDSDSDEDKAELLALIQSHLEDEVDEDTTKEEILKIVNEYDWKEEELTKDEQELLKNNDVKVVVKKKVTPVARKKTKTTTAKAKAKGKTAKTRTRRKR